MLDAADRAAVAAALAGWLGARRHRVHGAWGPVRAEAGATVTGTTRLVLAIAGRNAMQVPQGRTMRRLLLTAGDAVVIHRLAWNHPLHLFAKCFLTIDLQADRVRLYLRRTYGAGELPADIIHLPLRGAADPALRGAADAAEALAPDGGAMLVDAARLAVRLTTRLLPRPELTAEPLWQRLRDWAEERLHQPIGRAEAARACGVHPGHVSRVVARATGGGFAAWLAQRRLARACDLLVGSDLPVADIGRRCGFASATYFSQAFRAAIGTSPGRWRAEAARPTS